MKTEFQFLSLELVGELNAVMTADLKNAKPETLNPKLSHG